VCEAALCRRLRRRCRIISIATNASISESILLLTRGWRKCLNKVATTNGCV
jgi:hypothetical protein